MNERVEVIPPPVRFIEQLVACIDCGRTFPMQQMTLRTGMDGRSGFSCLACTEDARRQVEASYAKEMAEQGQRKGQANKAMDILHKLNTPHVCEVCEAIVEQFGGMKAYARFVVTQIAVAAANEPGSARVFRAVDSVNHLIVKATQERVKLDNIFNSLQY